MLSMKGKDGVSGGNADIGDDVKSFAELIEASCWGGAGEKGALTLAAGPSWHRCTLR